MRPKKSDIGRVAYYAKKMRQRRKLESYEQRQERLLKVRLTAKAKRRKIKEKGSLTSSVLNNIKALNGNANAMNIEEVNIQGSRSNERDPEQIKEENSLTNQDVEQNSKKDRSRTKPKDKSDICVLKAVKVEVMVEPLDCCVEEEQS